MAGRKRYSMELRLRVLRACERAKTPAEVTKILEKHEVPRSTYLAWRRKWEETGECGGDGRGRPPVKIRTIVREEIDRGLHAYLGRPEGKEK